MPKKKASNAGAGKGNPGKPKPGSGRRLSTVRWTVGAAAAEFGIDRRALTRKLADAGIVHGKDGKFSTRDIAGAIYDDGERARTRKIVAEAESAELELEQTRGVLVEADAIAKAWEFETVRVRQRLLRIPRVLKGRFFDGITAREIEDIAATEIESALFNLAKPIENQDAISGEPSSDGKRKPSSLETKAAG